MIGSGIAGSFCSISMAEAGIKTCMFEKGTYGPSAMPGAKSKFFSIFVCSRDGCRYINEMDVPFSWPIISFPFSNVPMNLSDSTC